MLEEKIFNYLKNNIPLKKVIGSRILPNKIDKNIKKPALSYFKFARYKDRIYKNGGAVKEHYQINIYSNTYNEAKAIEKEIVKLFDGVEGAIGNSFSKVTDIRDFYNNDLNMVVVDIEIATY